MIKENEIAQKIVLKIKYNKQKCGKYEKYIYEFSLYLRSVKDIAY